MACLAVPWLVYKCILIKVVSLSSINTKVSYLSPSDLSIMFEVFNLLIAHARVSILSLQYQTPSNHDMHPD